MCRISNLCPFLCHDIFWWTDLTMFRKISLPPKCRQTNRLHQGTNREDWRITGRLTGGEDIVETRKKSFQENLATTKSDFRTELNLPRIKARATRTDALTHQRNGEAKLKSPDASSSRSWESKPGPSGEEDQEPARARRSHQHFTELHLGLCSGASPRPWGNTTIGHTRRNRRT
jgi:hypothetical protein